MDKAGVALLPRDRAYSDVEAMFSLTVDIDEGKRKSVRDYARIWRWGRDRVHRFLHRHLAEPSDSDRTPAAQESDTRAEEKFTLVAGLRRSARGESDSERPRVGRRPATTTDPRSQRRKKNGAPWKGLTSDPERLLACDAFLDHLVKLSPELRQWDRPHVRAWARGQIRKAQGKGQRERFDTRLRSCARRAKRYEKPRLGNGETADRLQAEADRLAMGGLR